jgi:hypothetical protein
VHENEFVRKENQQQKIRAKKASQIKDSQKESKKFFTKNFHTFTHAKVSASEHNGGPGGSAGRRQLSDGDGDEQADAGVEQENHPARYQVSSRERVCVARVGISAQ